MIQEGNFPRCPQWAEPLPDNFSRVLAEDLSLLLATDHVAVFPRKGPVPMYYQMSVEVTRFLGAPGERSLWSHVAHCRQEWERSPDQPGVELQWANQVVRL